MATPQATSDIEAAPTRADAFSPLDVLPEEILVMITTFLGIDDITALLAWSLACRRHHGLVSDQTLWRRLYRRRFGVPLHKRFLDEGKDWVWLYRARACAVAHTATGKTVGAQDDCTASGSVYWGDLSDGKPCGYGVRFTDAPQATSNQGLAGTYDEGHWSDGTMRRGSRTRPDGAVYWGEWNDDGKYHGCGITAHSDGRTRYRGQWDQGSACGYGTADEPNSYTGEWDRGLPNGYGSAKWRGLQDDASDIDGTYRGMFRDGGAHGYGSVVYANGDRYEGEWKRGARDGYGMYINHAGGQTYRGCWENGAVKGRGVARYPNGDRYEGEWVDGEWCGYGIYTSSEGWTLCADFDRGAQRGYAVRTQTDGHVYRGCCFDGLPQGPGTLLYPGGTRQEGDFRDGALQSGRVTYADGSQYEGTRVGPAVGAEDTLIAPGVRRASGTWHGTVKHHGASCGVESPCMACVQLGDGSTEDS